MKPAEAVTQRSSKAWLKIAVACGALPMMGGVAALIVFLRSEATPYSLEVWGKIGAAVLIGGLALFCVGLVTLSTYLLKGRRQGVPGRDLAQNTMMTLILLLANFPAALACIWIAGDSISSIKIHFVNEATSVVEDLHITWPGGEQRIGDLAPDDTARISFLVSGDGTVDFTARQGGEPCEGNLIGYVTSNMGETDDVVFLDDCQVTVEMR